MSFAPVTEEFDVRFARTLPPAARTLWTWLRRMAPPEREIEFCLKDFAQQFSYTLKWGRHALTALAEHGLVEIVRRYYGYGFKVLVFQPGDIRQKSSPSREETSSPPNKTSQKTASNPHSSVSSDQKDLSRSASNQEGKENAPTEELTREAAQLVTEAANTIAPEPMNPQIRERLLTANPQIARSAIELVQYRKQFSNNKIASLPGLLMRAIENKWHLRDSERHRLRQTTLASNPAVPIAPAIPQGFREWFDLAHLARVAKASRAGQTGIEVLNSAEQWEPWEELAAAFPLPKLQEIVQRIGLPVQGYPQRDDAPLIFWGAFAPPEGGGEARNSVGGKGTPPPPPSFPV